MPALKRIDSLYHDQVQIIGIAQDDPERAQEFLKKYDVSWPQFQADDEIIRLLEVEGYPTYMLLDAKGRIVKLRIWPHEVEAFLKESSGKTTTQ